MDLLQPGVGTYFLCENLQRVASLLKSSKEPGSSSIFLKIN